MHIPRNGLGKIRVLIADHDPRTASLIHDVLRSFGFKGIQTVHNGQDAIDLLQKQPIDLLITEWDLHLIDGLRLVKAIRHSENGQRLDRDLPTIMLTAKADLASVQAARDAGFTEFVAKPFSARTLSARLLQMIDHPRSFVISEVYIGPCRRRKLLENNSVERRNQLKARAGQPPLAEILPPNKKLMKLIGSDVTAYTIFTDQLIERAQWDLLKKESLFIEWAREDIEVIEEAYAKLRITPSNRQAREQLVAATYRIKSQAGIFGYDMGTEVSAMLLDYLQPDKVIDLNCLTVVLIHIDTIRVIFQHKIKDNGHALSIDLLKSLQLLVKKLG